MKLRTLLVHRDQEFNYTDKWIYLSQYILGGRGMNQPFFGFFLIFSRKTPKYIGGKNLIPLFFY